MKRILGSSIVVAAAAACIAWYVQSSQLFINGNLASSSVIERNGTAYVPIKDVASALKLSIQKTGRGFELTDAGGANQVEGIAGKIGDVLYNGFARFQVIKVIRDKTYTTQFEPSKREILPIPEGNDLVIVVCRLKNAVNKTVGAGYTGGEFDAITDTDGHAYPPRRTSDLPSAYELLPGAATEFGLVFDVPPGAKLQDLVFQTVFVGVVNSDKKKFRVSLVQP